jgi:hypothetical protein
LTDPIAELFEPRDVEGLLVKLSKREDGGADVLAWRGGAWVPAEVSLAALSTSAKASPELLRRLGAG